MSAMAIALGSTASAAGNYVLHENLYYNLSTTPYTEEEGVLQAAVAIKDGRVNFAGDVYEGDITVPGFITVNNQKYAVTSVGDNCFAYQTKVTDVKLPATITSIGQYAFRETKIKDITLPASLTKVAMALFSRCDSLKSITCKAVTPPEAPATLSLGLNTPWVIVYVPAGSVDAYKAATGWGLFPKIEVMHEQQIHPTSITLDPKEYTGYIDSGFRLTATVMPEDADDKSVVYSSSDSAVATVDAEGNVKIVGEGKCTIIATSVAAPDVKGVCEVTGEKDTRVFPSSIEVTPSGANLPVGQSFKIEAKVLPEDAFDRSVQFLNSAPQVVSVDDEGNVKLLKPGVSMITVRSAYDHTIGEVVVVQVRPDTAEVNGMRYKYYPENATAKLLGPAGECPAVVNLPDRWLAGFSDQRYYTLVEIDQRAFEGVKTLTEITIPQTVDSIGLSAFSGCENLSKANIPDGIKVVAGGLFARTALKSIEIPDEVYIIDNQAFIGCSQLENVKIGKGLKMLYLMVFDQCPKLSEIVCDAVTPPAFFEAAAPAGVELNPFSKEIYETCELRVPTASVEAYKAAKVWSNFKHIVASDYDGIEGIEAEGDAAARYFNLQGIEVAEPGTGIYVKVQGGKSTVVYMNR